MNGKQQCVRRNTKDDCVVETETVETGSQSARQQRRDGDALWGVQIRKQSAGNYSTATRRDVAVRQATTVAVPPDS